MNPAAEIRMSPNRQSGSEEPTSLPHVPPESPLAMRTQKFDFISLRDIAGSVFAPLRPRGQPSLVRATSQISHRR